MNDIRWQNSPRAVVILGIDRKLTYDADHEYCPVRATLAILGQKWVPHILVELMAGKRRFNELGQRIGGCNSRTLRDRLKVLEELGIVRREIVATMPPWVEYELTANGHELGEALGQIQSWGLRHLAEPSAAAQF